MTRHIREHEAELLAEFVAAVRDDWDPPGIKAALGAARRRGDVYAVAIACLRAAADPGNRTPGVIPYDGAHWRASSHAAPDADRHPSAVAFGDLCPTHGKHRDTCGCDGHRRPPERRSGAERAHAWAEHIRAQLGWQRDREGAP